MVNLLISTSKDVGAQAMFVRDGNIDRILIGSIAFFQTQQLLSIAGQLPILLPVNVATRDQGLGSTNAKTDPALKIPRPPNAFIIYRKEHHASTVAKYPGIDNNGICKSKLACFTVQSLTCFSQNPWTTMARGIGRSSKRL